MKFIKGNNYGRFLIHGLCYPQNCIGAPQVAEKCNSIIKRANQ